MTYKLLYLGKNTQNHDLALKLQGRAIAVIAVEADSAGCIIDELRHCTPPVDGDAFTALQIALSDKLQKCPDCGAIVEKHALYCNRCDLELH